jgi:Emfourin
MKIEFSRTGGFAAPAMNQKVEIDTDQLPGNQAEELLKLVTKADIPSLAAQTPSTPRPDAFHYRVTIKDQGISRTATGSDADMPETLQPLVDWLTLWASKSNS